MVKSAVAPCIFFELRPTVKLLESKDAVASSTWTSSPALGLAGSVIVNAPPEVSHNILSPATAV